MTEAYEILGNPDKRALYDDFGHDHEGFETEWEFQQTKSRGQSDFFNGDAIVQKLTNQVCFFPPRLVVSIIINIYRIGTSEFVVKDIGL